MFSNTCHLLTFSSRNSTNKIKGLLVKMTTFNCSNACSVLLVIYRLVMVSTTIVDTRSVQLALGLLFQEVNIIIMWK